MAMLFTNPLDACFMLRNVSTIREIDQTKGAPKAGRQRVMTMRSLAVGPRVVRVRPDG